jgi:hypothetical protein
MRFQRPEKLVRFQEEADSLHRSSLFGGPS